MKKGLILLSFVSVLNSATYYVDLRAIYKHANAGTSSSVMWGGVAGMQRFFDVTNFDTCLVKGSSLTSKLMKIVYNNLTGTFTPGDTIRDSARTFFATIYKDSSTYMIVNVDSGSCQTTDRIYNSQISARASVNGAPTYPGIVIKQKNGTSNTPISIIGVNSSWIEDGTRDTLDGGTIAPVVSIGTAAGGSFYYYNWYNIAFRRTSATYIINQISPTAAQCWIFDNCFFGDNPTLSGVGGPLDQSIFYQCTFSGLNNGLANYTRYLYVSHCFFDNCGVCLSGVGGTFYQCIFSNGVVGGKVGISNYPLNLINCVIDSNSTVISAPGTNPINLEKCKFTSNTSLGSLKGGLVVYNLFLNNGAGDTLTGYISGSHRSTNIYSGVAGYTNKAIKNFAPANSATGRFVKVRIGGR